MTVERIRDFVVLAQASDGASANRADSVVVEEPLEIRLDGAPLAVVMRTPGHDIELAAGLLLAEEVVTCSDDFASIAHCTDGDDPNLTNVVTVKLTAERAGLAATRLAMKNAERATIASASCGVCGKRTIESLHTAAPPFDTAPTIDFALIARLPAALRQAQEVFDATGGLHAAAIFDSQGNLLVAREDVGRHNAVDKCVGYLMLREALPVPGAVMMLSGRASFEMVQKALVARIPIIASVSAPSSLAVELARESRIGLCGFVRGASLNQYSPAPPSAPSGDEL